MPNHARVLQGRFFPAKLETEGDDAIFNTLLRLFAGKVGGVMMDAGRAAMPTGEEISVMTGIGGAALIEPTPIGEIGFAASAGVVGLRGLGRAADVIYDAARGAGNSFSVITSAPVSGTTRSAHRASANADLAAALRADSAYAAQMNKEFGTDVLGHMQSGRGGLRNPPGTEWHHPKADPSSMWLLKGDVHRSPSLQNYLHGGGSGGFADYYGK